MNSSVPSSASPWRSMAFRAGICFVATCLGWILFGRSEPLSLACFAVAYVSGVWDLAKHVWVDLRSLRFNTEFLMLLVAIGAAAIGSWKEGALLLVLFSASAAMETFASDRTQREIRSLLKGAPKTARLLEGGVEREVTVESLRPGQEIRVTANEQIPVDFEVLRGESACDESTLTGEAEPVSKSRGDTLLAGTLNLWGVLEGRVLRPAGESALQRIIQLIHDAQQQKAPAQRFTDRFGTRYTMAVIAGCLIWFFIHWVWLGYRPFVSEPGHPSAFYRAMTLLVVLSPCALVLSVPSAILSAIACGARHGVLFRGGAAVETLAEVSVVAMDKTGTLTEGTLNLVAVDVLEGTEDAVLTAAGSLAQLSNHPISRSLAREARRRDLPQLELTASETIAGQGIRARQGNDLVGLGNRALLGDRLSPNAAAQVIPVPAGTNETWVFGPGVLGRLQLRDRLRPQARGLVAELHRAGLRTVMLTGDRTASAQRMAADVGVSEVIADLKPEQKVEAVKSLRRDGRVAMVGDGVNDAPVIAVADVGVAMGARGSDAALEQADIVLMNDRLENFLFARELSQRARSVIRQNLWIALGTMSGMAVATLTISELPLWSGVAAHEGSTVVVVLNSLRLLFAPGPDRGHP
ncbi:MAG TPA: cation-translocating P-type ATPase [Verrucomicrobiota bacterium]|nr:cation-translocating P-type ATPase [Verrucomicrobiota bacterium]